MVISDLMPTSGGLASGLLADNDDINNDLYAEVK